MLDVKGTELLFVSAHQDPAGGCSRLSSGSWECALSSHLHQQRLCRSGQRPPRNAAHVCWCSRSWHTLPHVAGNAGRELEKLAEAEEGAIGTGSDAEEHLAQQLLGGSPGP